MEKIIITERNRDGAKIWLEHHEGNDYTIHTDKDYVLEYCCINYDELDADATDYDNKFTDQFGKVHLCHNVSFDPAGGPYMGIGMEIGDKKLKRIHSKDKKFLFTLE